jgi:hypothetical protein
MIGCLFAMASTLALGPSLPPIQLILGVLSPGIKRLGVRLTIHLHLVLKIKMRGAMPPLLQYMFMARYLVKHVEDFIFTFYFSFSFSKDAVRITFIRQDSNISGVQ